MKYISIDFETTGLDENECQILEMGVVWVNTKTDETKEFYKIVRNDFYSGSEYAINLNARIFNLLNENIHPSIIHIENLGISFNNFLYECGYSKGDKINVAGKNVQSLDLKFLNKYLLKDIDFKFSHKALDPEILFLNYFEDEEVPGLEECKVRAGFEQTKVTHNALEDAWDIVNLLNYKLKSNTDKIYDEINKYATINEFRQKK